MISKYLLCSDCVQVLTSKILTMCFLKKIQLKTKHSSVLKLCLIDIIMKIQSGMGVHNYNPRTLGNEAGTL
jgi:hypothetical protein